MTDDKSAHDHINKAGAPDQLSDKQQKIYRQEVNEVLDLIDEIREHTAKLAELESIVLGESPDELKYPKALMVADVLFRTEADGDIQTRLKMIDKMGSIAQRDLQQNNPAEAIRRNIEQALNQHMSEEVEVEMELEDSVPIDHEQHEEIKEKIKDIDSAEDLKDFIEKHSDNGGDEQ